MTRWRLADLLAGVADLGVYDAAVAKGAHLYLRYDLHAKLFVADDRCLVGSANVTDTALGWRSPENLELLVTVLRSERRWSASRSSYSRARFVQLWHCATVLPRSSTATGHYNCRA